jgi:hypothetical protein
MDRAAARDAVVAAAYIDVFHTLMLLAALVIPLATILRRAPLGAAPPMAH